MVTPQTRRFDARSESFPEMRGFIERFCADTGVGYRASARLILILEELFANTVDHGYPRAEGGLAEWPVWLTLAAAGGRVEVVYEDAASAHDPFANATAPDFTSPAEKWQVGGLGIVLVTQLGRNVRYERTGDRNRIRLTVPIPGPGA